MTIDGKKREVTEPPKLQAGGERGELELCERCHFVVDLKLN